MSKIVHVEVRPRKNESFERLLKRFKKQVYKSKVLRDYVDKTRFMSKKEKKELKRERAKQELKMRGRR